MDPDRDDHDDPTPGADEDRTRTSRHDAYPTSPSSGEGESAGDGRAVADPGGDSDPAP